MTVIYNAKPGDKVKFSIRSEAHEKVTPVTIRVSDLGFAVVLAGYGTKTEEGDGEPVYIDTHYGHPSVYIWADMNQEDPTHVVGLPCAATNLYEKESDMWKHGEALKCLKFLEHYNLDVGGWVLRREVDGVYVYLDELEADWTHELAEAQIFDLNSVVDPDFHPLPNPALGEWVPYGVAEEERKKEEA